MRVLSILIVLAASVYAQDKAYYFHHPENNFGSDMFFSPFSILFNGSFDILRNGGHTKNITKLPYEAGMNNVWQNISHPFKNIDAYGTQKFMRREIFNLNFNPKEMQFVPNIMNHTIGNGMQYVKLAEWYDAHEVPAPYVLSFVTTTTYQFINESNENGSGRGTNVDPISDMLIFNPLGFLLFSFDGVKYFFSNTVPLYDWSPQPVYNPSNHSIQNAGQEFVIKKQVSQRWSGLFYWGINGMLGASYTPDGIHHFGAAGGVVVNKLNVVGTEASRYVTPALDGTIGFFYDKNNSLMTSLILTGPKFYTAQVNVYPGVFTTKWFCPGIYLGLDEKKSLLFGMAFANFPIGLLAQTR